MRILITEDDPVSRRVLEKLLEKWGHQVSLCENGIQAWELYQSGDFRLLISDWMMPEMDGLELCRRIRSLKRKGYCYFILLTAKVGKGDLLEGMAAGADDYLTKPVNSEELKMRLEVAERILSLQRDVESLRSTLPICAWCKSIRDDTDLWHSVEEYLASHTDSDLSHSICPQCTSRQIADSKKEHESLGDLQPRT
jgi:phosphoserine phosphatase RsbU/P